MAVYLTLVPLSLNVIKVKVFPSHAMLIQKGDSVYLAVDDEGRSLPCPGRFTPEKRALVPIVQEAVWAPGLVWKGVEKR